MFDPNNVPIEFIKEIKRYIQVSWSDNDTDQEIIDEILNAEKTLNHKLGAEYDYTKPGQEKSLFKNYMLYSWNKCLNEFDSAYKEEIYQIRHKAEVANYEKQISALQ